MFMQATRFTICTMVLWAAVVSGAQAADPVTQDVFYKIHDDPDDPNSTVTFTIMLCLKKAETDGNSIGWDITGIRFRQPGEIGSASAVWIDSDPNVPTGDGLWWVEHADPDDPQLGEFDLPPHLVGTAMAADPDDDDLEYDFEGVSYTPPAGGAPWDNTAGLNYGFTIEGESGGPGSSTDEPVEVEDDDDPPME